MTVKITNIEGEVMRTVEISNTYADVNFPEWAGYDTPYEEEARDGIVDEVEKVTKLTIANPEKADSIWGVYTMDGKTIAEF